VAVDKAVATKMTEERSVMTSTFDSSFWAFGLCMVMDLSLWSCAYVSTYALVGGPFV